ncbi:hypothetical protein OsccyDRAFT_4484 [Leptolyngbyaceae cyanobacterium JSC-12]|nr:hypothetical protein OsccyDRAFT_4484 [Leptolyngbyaceae cyanobacterium JSC-12]
MTDQQQHQVGTHVAQCKVIANIESVRETLTKKLKQYSESKLRQKTDLQIREDERFQREIARLIVLLQRTERLVIRTSSKNSRKLGELNNLVSSLKIGISTLFDTPPNIELSRQIRLTVEQEIIRNENPPVFRLIARRFSYAWHSPSTPLKVIHGLLFSFLVIFGGLFTLAIFQYAVYRSHTSVVSYSELKELTEAQQGELARKIKELNSKIVSKRKDLLGSTKVTSQVVVNPKITNASQDSYTRGELLELEEDKKLLGERKIELKQNLLRSKPSSTQEFLANFFDIGISKTLSQILWVAAAGTLGSIISILIRVIDEFNNKEYQDRLTPFFLGFFKPVIGASFGVLFLAIYNAEFVNIPFITRTNQTSTPLASKTPVAVNQNSSTFDTERSETGMINFEQINRQLNTVNNASSSLILSKNLEAEKERKEVFFLFAIAFVVGFSERLAKDTIGRIDGSNVGSDKSNDSGSSFPRIIVVRSSKSRSTKPGQIDSCSNEFQPTQKQLESDLDQNQDLNEETRDERSE